MTDLGRQDRLRVQVEQAGGYMLVSADGEIDYETADLLHERLDSAAIASATPNLILDLERITFCDSSGLRALVATWKAVTARDGRFVIARASEQCQRLLKRTGLEQILTLAPTLEAARQAVGPPDAAPA